MQYDILKGIQGTNPFMANFAVLTTATTTVGETVLFKGYDAMVFHICAPVLATGTYAPKIMLRQKSDSTFVELTDTTKINGAIPDATASAKILAATLSGAGDAKKCTKIGVYNVQDLYDAVRLDIVSTGTVSGTIFATAVLGHANNMQCETQKVSPQ